jgi:gas vesicle protein
MNAQKKWIIGALAVAALGAVVAALFGTDEGRIARRDMKRKARKMRNKTLQQVGEFKVGARRRYAAVTEAANTIIDEGKEKLSGIVGNTTAADTTGPAANGQ